METCFVCVEPYNKRGRLCVKCPYCEFAACRTCCQTYMLSEMTPKCMNPDCAKEWTLHFLRSTFPNSFLNSEMKAHREEVLFQQEVAMVPATPPIVEREIVREGIRKEVAVINNEIARLTREIQLLWARYPGNTTAPVGRSEFVRNCPVDDCRGFLSSQWKCSICNNWTCPTCHEVKGPDRNIEHTCCPENVATAELLARDTRYCPKCTTPIFKIDGCDQMWCTQCQTGFSWRTGRIENNVHNPHYFEWLRRTGGIRNERNERNERNGGCERELSHRLVVELERLMVAKLAPTNPIISPPTHITNETAEEVNLRRARYYRSPDLFRNPNAEEAYNRLSRIIRATIHLNLVERNRFRNDHILDNQDLRIQYMRNSLSPEKFKTLIQQRNKKQHKNREITNVLDIFIHTATDIIFRFREYLANSEPTECDLSILDEIDQIRDYANECLSDISHTYGSVLMNITGELRLISVS